MLSSQKMRNPLAWLITGAGGAICLPATYWLTRRGSLFLSLTEIIMIGAVAGLAGHVVNPHRSAYLPRSSIAAFVVGAAISEIAIFANNHVATDPKGSVGFDLSVIELVVICVLGLISMAIAVRVLSKD